MTDPQLSSLITNAHCPSSGDCFTRGEGMLARRRTGRSVVSSSCGWRPPNRLCAPRVRPCFSGPLVPHSLASRHFGLRAECGRLSRGARPYEVGVDTCSGYAVLGAQGNRRASLRGTNSSLTRCGLVSLRALNPAPQFYLNCGAVPVVLGGRRPIRSSGKIDTKTERWLEISAEPTRSPLT
jgi:hypothetical protein